MNGQQDTWTKRPILSSRTNFIAENYPVVLRIVVISGGNDSQQASAGTGNFSQAGVGKWEFSQYLFFFWYVFSI